MPSKLAGQVATVVVHQGWRASGQTQDEISMGSDYTTADFAAAVANKMGGNEARVTPQHGTVSSPTSTASRASFHAPSSAKKRSPRRVPGNRLDGSRVKNG